MVICDVRGFYAQHFFQFWARALQLGEESLYCVEQHLQGRIEVRVALAHEQGELVLGVLPVCDGGERPAQVKKVFIKFVLESMCQYAQEVGYLAQSSIALFPLYVDGSVFSEAEARDGAKFAG